MPNRTTKANPTKRRLLARKAPSRLMGESMPPGRVETIAPPGDQPHPGEQDDPEEAQQQRTDGGLRERVHRLDDPGPGQEGSEDGQAEGRHHQREVPDPQQTAALLDHHRVEVGRAHQPRQQRGVLHRVPPPEAAPAEDLVRPPGPEQDAHREEGPGEQGPPAGLALPVLVEPTGDQRGDGKGEGKGEADQTQVEHGRVDEDQRIVLEERVRPGTVGGDGADHVRERVGRSQHEAEEERRHHVDDQGGPGHQLGHPTVAGTATPWRWRSHPAPHPTAGSTRPGPTTGR